LAVETPVLWRDRQLRENAPLATDDGTFVEENILDFRGVDAILSDCGKSNISGATCGQQEGPAEPILDVFREPKIVPESSDSRSE
jgi:hypothetical protein